MVPQTASLPYNLNKETPQPPLPPKEPKSRLFNQDPPAASSEMVWLKNDPQPDRIRYVPPFVQKEIQLFSSMRIAKTLKFEMNDSTP